MHTIYIIAFVPLLLFALVFLYFTVVRKNDFEKRLELFRPTRQLSQKHEAYMQGARKYYKYAAIVLLLIFYLPLCIFIFMMLKESYEQTGRLYIAISDEVKMLMTTALIPVVAIHYLIIYIMKRNNKALRMLVEQMSNEDFELLLKIKEYLPLTNKYSPPFVWCNEQLYVFIFFAAREIDPTKITDIQWVNGKNGVFVHIKAERKTTVGMPRKVFPIFVRTINQYFEFMVC